MLKRALIILAVLIALPYACGPVYDFPDVGPFAGEAFYNPYESLLGQWQRANFHAHGRAWGGLTSGRQPSEAVARAYRAIGYSVPGVSNYHHIAAFDGVPTIPLYEHGYNIGKHHQIAIGARRVDWFDFPLWQSLSHQQFVIDRVGRTADLVALAHPPSRDAYSEDDLRWLTGYQLLEVVNGPHHSEVPWDAALSSGHAVWALANDDSHDLNDPRRTAMAWNMLDARSAANADVVDALRAGRAYAVMRTNTTASAIETLLHDVQFADGTLRITCTGEPSTFSFVGQNGVVRHAVPNAMSAEYSFGADDTYIRTVVRSPRTTMYLNPVFRYDGARLPAPSSAVNVTTTWLMRGSVVLVAVAAAAAYRRRQRLVLNSLDRPVLTDANQSTA